MKQRLRIPQGIFALAAVLALAMVMRAAEEGGSPAEQPIGNVFKWIHFVILAIVAYWLFKKVLPPVFRHNADRISAAITKATAAKAEAEKQLNEAAVKLASLEQEVAHFRAQAQKEAAAEVERLRAITKIDIEKVSLAAKAEIEAAERAARVELKALAAKLAVDRAESLVSKQMTPAVQEAMLNHFVQSLQGRPN
jgi:F0F1-type ATP synthase membrane subunit b/b'